MSPESKLQPPILQNRNSAADYSLGNKSDSHYDLSQTIENLRESSPLLADQIDYMVANTPENGMDGDRYWLFLHSQFSYTHNFIKSGKDEDFFAPPKPSSYLTISVDDLKKTVAEVKLFTTEYYDEISDDLENPGLSGASKRQPKPV